MAYRNLSIVGTRSDQNKLNVSAGVQNGLHLGAILVMNHYIDSSAPKPCRSMLV